MNETCLLHGRHFVPLLVSAMFTSLEHVFVEVRYQDASPVQRLSEENIGFAISEERDKAPRIAGVRLFGRYNQDGVYELRLDDQGEKSGRLSRLYTVHVTRVSTVDCCIEAGRTTALSRDPWMASAIWPDPQAT